MNADLEATLAELGDDYRPVVDRLRAAREVEPTRVRWPWFRSAPAVAAACVAVLLGVGLVAAMRPGGRGVLPDATSAVVAAANLPSACARSPYRLAYETSSSAVAEILRTQGADGSWSTDFLTQQNAAALKDVATAQVAYRRAVRYLRTRGLAPLTDDEFRRWRDQARS